MDTELSNRNSITIHGKIHPIKPKQESKIIGKFKYQGRYEQLPFDIEKDKHYIVTAWDTNVYIRGLKENSFEIFDQYGSDLEIGNEYLIIQPAF